MLDGRLAVPGARRSDPRGPEGVRLSAAARSSRSFRSRRSRSTSSRCSSPLGLLALLGLTLRLLEVRDVRCYAAALLWVPSISGVLLGERLDPARVRARRALALPRPRLAAGRRARARGLGEAPPLADVRLDARDAAASRTTAAGRRDRRRRDARRVGGDRVRRARRATRISLRRLSDIQAESSYSIVGMAATLGLGEAVGQALDARRRRRAARRRASSSRAAATTSRSFTCAVAATLALSPIVWLHYLVVLLVPLAIAAAAVLGDLAAARPALGQPEARLRGGIRRRSCPRSRRRSCSACCSPGRAAERAASAAVGVIARTHRATSADAGRARRSRRRLARVDRLLRRASGAHARRRSSRARSQRRRRTRSTSGSSIAAAEAILDGENPYPAADDPLTAWGGRTPYPPLPALLAMPLTALSARSCRAPRHGCSSSSSRSRSRSCSACATGAATGSLLLWPPVISAIQTGNVTLWLALAAALAWRFRDRLLALVGERRRHARGEVLPLAARRLARGDAEARERRARAARSARCSSLVSWAAIGFAGFVDYPDLLRRLEDTVGEDSYTLVHRRARSRRCPRTWRARSGLRSGSGCSLRRRRRSLVAVTSGPRSSSRSPRRSRSRRSSGSTTSRCSLVVVALARPRLGLVWFVPLAMVVTPGSGHPTPLRDRRGRSRSRR